MFLGTTMLHCIYVLVPGIRGDTMKSYVVELEQDDDGRWGAEIPSLPGCAVWGYTREEALAALRDVAQAYLEVLEEHNNPLPSQGVQNLS
jgi:predicted RNase H-like HicB family nuclease